MFWVMVLMMICAGASEHAVCQWASAFAERGLGVSKAVGDLTGPMAFAVLMGSSRVLHSAKGHKWNLRNFIIFSTVLCLISYCMISLVPNPVVNLIGCAICGFSIAIMWPGTLSIAAKTLPRGGTAMFAILALAGDIGCSGGPTLVGMVSGAFGDNLKLGILTASVFPIAILLCLFWGKLGKEKA
jgi:fucose permease